MLLVNHWKPFANVTKSSILDALGVLDAQKKTSFDILY